MTPPLTPPLPVSFTASLRYWLKLGFISFGGPAGQIAMMHLELVERRRWISEQRFLHALNFCMVLPGPEAQQLATYIGWLMHGVKGGIAAGVLFVLPSLFILIGLTWVYLAFGHLPAIAGLLYGIKPAVTAIVLFAAYRIGSRALRNGVLWMIAATAFVAIFAFNIPFPTIVLAAAVLGMLGGKYMPGKFRTGGGHGASGQHYGAALIDDDTPTPAHARFSWMRLGTLLVVGLLLWGGAMLLLSGQTTLYTMGGFFTKAALVTFGGAYAVLPYVFQGGVEHYQWLTAHQMIDGLALGETTPGPLIMVVAFVGFIGGWGKALFGHGLVDRLGHVVDRQQRDRDRDHRLHFHAGARGERGGGGRLDPVLHQRQVDRHRIEAERVAQRDQVGGFLRRHDPGNARGGKHVALCHRAVADRVEGLRRHSDAADRHGYAVRFSLGADIDHARLALRIEVGEFAHAFRPKGDKLTQWTASWEGLSGRPWPSRAWPLATVWK